MENGDCIERIGFQKKSRVDWTAQWEQHAPNFHNGYAQIDLAHYGRAADPLRLHPGAGFGDCSHSTTCLTLRLMANRVQDRILLDIGCGSGILSLAGARWGATQAIGIDIEADALEHAKLNSQLNELSNTIFVSQLPTCIHGQPLIVINMISSEQRLAWQSSPAAHALTCPVIASGILASEREQYLQEVREKRGWYLTNEMQEGEWLAFCFNQTARYF